MKITTLITLSLGLLLSSCNNENNQKIDINYSDETTRIKIQEVRSKIFSTSYIGKSKSPYIFSAERIGIIQILKSIIDNQSILITANESPIKNKLFNCSIEYQGDARNQDSIIFTKLSELLEINVDHKTELIDSINFAVLDSAKLQSHQGEKIIEESPHNVDGTVENISTIKNTNGYLTLRNVPVSELVKKLSTKFNFRYNIEGLLEQRIDFEVSTKDWNTTKNILIDDLGIEIKEYKIEQLKYIIK